MEFIAKIVLSSSNVLILALLDYFEELAFAHLYTFPKSYNCRMIVG